MLAHPRPRELVEVPRDAAVVEPPPGCPLCNRAGVRLLPHHVRRDAGDGSVRAVGVRVVADVEVQAAVRRGQRRPVAGDDDVSNRRRREGERDAERERGCEPPAAIRDQQQRDARRGNRDVRAIADLEPVREAGEHAPPPAAAREAEREARDRRRGQERIERRLKQQSLVEGEQAGERRHRGREPCGAPAEPRVGCDEHERNGAGAEQRLDEPHRGK